MILWFEFQRCTIMQSLQTCLNRKIVIKITNDNINVIGIYHNTSYRPREHYIILFYKQLTIKPLILLSFFHLNPTYWETLLLAFPMHNILYWGVQQEGKHFLFIYFYRTQALSSMDIRHRGAYSWFTNTWTQGEDSSLKTRVVTHPGTSDDGRCLISEHISDWTQLPSHTCRPPKNFF